MKNRQLLVWRSSFIKNCHLDGIKLPRCSIVPLRHCAIFFIARRPVIVLSYFRARFSARHSFTSLLSSSMFELILGRLITIVYLYSMEGKTIHKSDGKKEICVITFPFVWSRGKRKEDGKIEAKNVRVRTSTFSSFCFLKLQRDKSNRFLRFLPFLGSQG